MRERKQTQSYHQVICSVDANRYCFKLFPMNIVISTSSLDILIMTSSSSTTTGINYIMTLVV